MCDNNMSFEECELRLLRNAVDKLEKQSKKIIMNPEINRMILILEDFLKKRKDPVMEELLLIIYYQKMTNFMIRI